MVMEGNRRTRLKQLWCSYDEINYQKSEVQEHLTNANQATTKPPSGFSISNSLNASHSEESMLIPCDFCLYKSPSFDALVFHTRTKHTGKGILKCDQCRFKTSTKTSLAYHTDTKHSLRLECETCGFMAKNNGSLKYHQGKSHKHIGRYFCDECDASFTANPKLKNHILTRHRGFTHNCNMCAYKAFGTSSLKKHIEREHDGTRFMCDKCDFMFKGRFNLANHIRIKHEGFRYTCDICDYKVTQKRVLDKHRRIKHDVEMSSQKADQGIQGQQLKTISYTPDKFAPKIDNTAGVNVTHREKESNDLHKSEYLEKERNHINNDIEPGNYIPKEGLTKTEEMSCKEKFLEKSVDGITDNLSENRHKPIILNHNEDTEFDDIVEDIDYEETFVDVEHKNTLEEIGVPAIKYTKNNPDNTKKQVHATENNEPINSNDINSCEIQPVKTKQIKMSYRTRSFGCDTCNFKCLEKNQMVYHKEIHHEYDTFYCSQCNYSANYQSHVQDHTEAIHNEKIYQCNQCSYQATCRSDLAHHNTWIHKVEDGDEEFMFVD